MRKIIIRLFYILLTFLILDSAFFIRDCQGQWVWQNPMPSSTELGKAFFLNANTCWVPSGYGRITKTTNGGLNWINQSWLNDISISGIYFVDENTGWAVGSSGTILKSTNGGSKWIQQTSNTTGDLYCVRFINHLTGWSGGYNFLRTTNGGVNWIISNQIGDQISSLYFVNSMTGWLSCNHFHIQKTTDGGISFQSTNVPSDFNNDVFFINESTGWVAGMAANSGDGIYKTTDAGNNWTEYFVSGNECCYRSLYFKDINTGWVTTITGRMYKTTNGGINWSNPVYPGGSRLNFVYFSDNNTGYTGGGIDPTYSGPAMTKTTNSGLNWTSLVLNQNYSFRSISVVNSNVAFTAGYYSCIGRTTNSGEVWEINNNNWGILNSVLFVNEQTGWITGWTSDGNYSTLIKTTNSGISWVNQDSSYWTAYLGLYFLNNNTGWASGYRLIKKTTNSGANWQRISGYDTTNTYYAVYFADANTGWAAYGNPNFYGGILNTTNGGINWISQCSNEGVSSFYFVNSNTGYAAGSFSGILKTTNGGINWYLVNNSLKFVRSLYFTDENNGWVVGATEYGSRGYISKSSNGGINWTLSASTPFGLNCIKFADANTGWAVGAGGAILKTTNGGFTFVSKISNEVSRDYVLLQNYPNPFNPRTAIRFQVTGNSNVSIKIFDINGREVQTLVNERLNAGTYSTEWDASAYPSGVYFYRMVVRHGGSSTGDFSETKRMMLIK